MPEKHFLIGGLQFVYKIIHLPVLRHSQPIETLQSTVGERKGEKIYFSTWATSQTTFLSFSLARSRSLLAHRKLSCALSQVFNFFSFFSPASKIIFFLFSSASSSLMYTQVSESSCISSTRCWQLGSFLFLSPDMAATLTRSFSLRADDND
jgi:hypothetical protein